MHTLLMSSIYTYSPTIVGSLGRNQSRNQSKKMMEQNRAAIIKEAHGPVVVEPVETWVPGPGEVLVRNEAISFNPIEAKIQK